MPKPVVCGDAVVALRKSKGMSQVQMACALGVDRHYLKNVEAQAKPVKPALLDKMHRAFGVTEEDLRQLACPVQPAQP